jgi:acetyltransferase-like isoleucine patch superfamily enzyme
MKRHPLAAAISAKLRVRKRQQSGLELMKRLEGGQMTSLSLRAYLKRAYGVEVESYSYGSLMDPGNSDRGLSIGRYVSIGPNVRRFGAAHPVDRLSMHPYWYNPALRVAEQADDVERTTCRVEHEAWIGANVTILPGCGRIGIGAVIGAGAVVTRDVPDFAVVLGLPGTVKSERLNDAARDALLQTQPWLKEPAQAASAYRKIAEELGDPQIFMTSGAP